MPRSKDRVILIISFILFLAINGYLSIIHEPWRDEIHAWLMAKYMNIPDMILFSRYEGHPLLWHFILMPFAKLGAPVWVMSLISYAMVSVSAYIFLFRIKWNTAAKIITLFTIPFLYTYSAVARNYCLILLLGMIIAVMYEKRYDHPFLYSIPVTLMVFTHAMAWGFVAGLTITFHIYEIGRFILKRSQIDKKRTVLTLAGLIMIAIATITVIITLYGGVGFGFSVSENGDTNMLVISMVSIMAVIAVYVCLKARKNIREMLILVMSFSFMIVIYKTVYSSILLQRLVLVQVFLLFFALCTYEEGRKTDNLLAIGVFFISFVINGSIIDTVYYISEDITGNYSSGKEMGEYIRENLPDETVILADAGNYAQSVMPYIDQDIYDIKNEKFIKDNMYVVREDENLVISAIQDIPNHEEYKGKYIIMFYAFENSPFEEIYRTSGSIMGEDYTLYYIP